MASTKYKVTYYRKSQAESYKNQSRIPVHSIIVEASTVEAAEQLAKSVPGRIIVESSIFPKPKTSRIKPVPRVSVKRSSLAKSSKVGGGLTVAPENPNNVHRQTTPFPAVPTSQLANLLFVPESEERANAQSSLSPAELIKGLEDAGQSESQIADFVAEHDRLYNSHEFSKANDRRKRKNRSKVTPLRRIVVSSLSKDSVQVTPNKTEDEAESGPNQEHVSGLDIDSAVTSISEKLVDGEVSSGGTDIGLDDIFDESDLSSDMASPSDVYKAKASRDTSHTSVPSATTDQAPSRHHRPTVLKIERYETIPLRSDGLVQSEVDKAEAAKSENDDPDDSGDVNDFDDTEIVSTRDLKKVGMFLLFVTLAILISAFTVHATNTSARITGSTFLVGTVVGYILLLRSRKTS